MQIVGEWIFVRYFLVSNHHLWGRSLELSSIIISRECGLGCFGQSRELPYTQKKSTKIIHHHYGLT
ncbi:hypothetical protein HanPSC8_Chr15g0677261 [Helianthus annuus]|nr:hypothetical protein HanPSC8_Chr15g0677261 [Helianthus annuus]